MSDLLQIVKGLSMQPKCVLVLGARTEAMLNWLFSLTTTQVVLVEPEPAMFEKATLLHSAKGSPESVVIKHGVPAFEAKQKSMRYFVSNVPGYSSVLPPNVIKSIRPALEFTEQDTAVIELKPLLQQYDISESRPCLLISQLNGAEQQCLNYQLLNAFTHVVMQSSLKPVFGESKPAEKLQKEFTECGRDYLVLAESMPPYSNFLATKKVNTKQALSYFSQRQQHREIKAELENQLNASQSNAKNVEEELHQTKQQLHAAKQQSEEKQKHLSGELQQAKEQLQIAKKQSEEKQKQLGDELQQAKEQLQIAKQQSEEKQKQLGGELQQAKEQLQTAKQQSEEKQKQLGDELQQAKEQLQTAQQQSEEKQKQLGGELQQAKEQLQTAKQQSEEKQKQLGDELQQAKKQLKTAKQNSEEVQKQLRDELQQAKEQLQTVKLQSEERQKQLGDELQQAKEQLQTAQQQSEEKQQQLSAELQQVKQDLKAERQRYEESKASLNHELALQKQTVENVCSERDEQRKELLEKIEYAQNSENKQIAVLELTNKLNLKLQADLDALRDSYAKKAKDETELKELVNELYAKLKHASKFYYELEKKYPELIEEQRG